MLSELYIRDFAIIDSLRIQFEPGFNVLTGETGAGKSIILDAVTLILGGRGDATFIRAGAERAYVEATFALDAEAQAAVLPILRENELDDESQPHTLIVAREIRLNGRNICRINGSSANTSLLRDLGELLIGIHGQGEHLALLKPKSHLPLLDGFAGLQGQQAELSAAVRELRGLQKELAELQQDERVLQQRMDILKFQLEEIDAANLRIGEDEELRTERTRLGNMEQLVRHCQMALGALAETDDGDSPSAIDLVGQAEAAVTTLAKLDPTQETLHTRLISVSAELEEVISDLRDYFESLEHDPARLAEIEERLELINRFKRKYGDDIGEILALRDKAAMDLDKIEHSSERIETLTAEIDKRLRALGAQAQKLSAARKEAAERLAKTIEKELGDLKMTAQFAVDFATQPDPHGAYVGDERLAFDYSGIDRVEFLISTNPGEPLKPMAKVASGGETARLMLALKTALAQVDETPTLIFDEIDQGIGGRIGSIVGHKLWSLTSVADHQVIVVTHLPQMAGFGDAHYHVAKHVTADGRTRTDVTKLDISAKIDELGAMLGTKEDLGRVSARSILKEAQAVKGQPVND